MLFCYPLEHTLPSNLHPSTLFLLEEACKEEKFCGGEGGEWPQISFSQQTTPIGAASALNQRKPTFSSVVKLVLLLALLLANLGAITILLLGHPEQAFLYGCILPGISRFYYFTFDFHGIFINNSEGLQLWREDVIGTPCSRKQK